MVDIGHILREAREAQGLSLAEVEGATRIRVRFLEALEENNFATLGGDLYTRGFLKNYALFLGIEPTPLLAQLGVVENPLPATPPPAPTRYLDEPLHSNPLPIGRIVFMLLLLLALGGLGLSLWWPAAQRDALLARTGLLTALATPTMPTAAPSPTQGAAEGVLVPPVTQTTLAPRRSPTPDAQGRATAVPTATLPPRTPTPDPNATATPTATAIPQGVVLGARIVGDTWVRVFIDAQVDPIIERTLRVGETFEWVGTETIRLRAGNAGGISLTLNGQDIGVLGNPGEVIERRWQRDPNGGVPVLVEPQG